MFQGRPSLHPVLMHASCRISPLVCRELLVSGSGSTLAHAPRPRRPDIESLPALLRSIRWCKSMVIAYIPSDLVELSTADLLLCILADRVYAEASDISIVWSDAPPALERFVLQLWEGAAGATQTTLTPRPESLGDLRKVAMCIGADEMHALETGLPLCTQPEFLVGLRRMGVLRVGKMDKMTFNFYWVAKVLRLNALPEMAGQGVETQRGLTARPDLERRATMASESMTASLGADGTLQLVMKAAVLDMKADEIWKAVIPHVHGAKRVSILLPAAEPGALKQLLPGEVLAGRATIYKWYRKWDLMLGKLIELGPVACELRGPTAPLLIEVFFAADARAWCWPDSKVGFRASGYMPGSACCRTISHCGRASQRAILLGGVPIDDAIRLGLVSELSKAHTIEAIDTSSVLPMLMAQAEARRNNAPGGFSKPLCDVLSLQQSLPSATSFASTRLSQRPVLAGLLGVCCTLPEIEHELAQIDVSARLRLDKTTLHGLFEADHVKTRTLAELASDAMANTSNTPSVSMQPGSVPRQGELTDKHLRWARGMLMAAVTHACRDAEVELAEVGCITICTSTGYLLPGLSAYVVHDLGLPMSTARYDIVGMGCHAGLNSLSCATNWAHANPGKVAISAGVEVCSAGFVWPVEKSKAQLDAMDETQRAAEQKVRVNHAVVNSLFADGAYAAVLFCPPQGCPMPPNYLALHKFKSLTATCALDTMVHKWSDEYKQFWFYLSEDAPYAVGGALFAMLHHCQADVPMESIRHWVMHTGGQTVIDAAAASLGLDPPELEPTVRALKRYGNQSSASYMFAFSEFIATPPSPVTPGDLGAFITMGPGAGFEFALWSAGTRSCAKEFSPLAGWVPGNLEPPAQSNLVRRVADPPHSLSFHPGASVQTGGEHRR